MHCSRPWGSPRGSRTFDLLTLDSLFLGTFLALAGFRFGYLCRGGLMDPINKPAESLSDDSRYRLLIEAVTDYAIYMLDPDGYRDELESRRATLQGIRTL